jgi:hypothetical protein
MPREYLAFTPENDDSELSTDTFREWFSSMRSLRVRQRLTVLGILGAVAANGALSCGDDKPAPQQSVLWFGLGTALGATCSSARTFSFPDDTARDTILGSSGNGTRAVDGSDYLVDCTVKQNPSGADYNVSLRFQGGEVGNFIASGVLTAPAAAAAGQSTADTDGTVDISFNTTQFALEERSCTAKVHTLVPGAIWLSSLSCDALKDPSSPSISCRGTGGVIFENCSH